MLLTLTTTHEPATDLGFLLHKNPASVRSEQLWFGTAHVFYPEASRERATAALLLEVDPMGLARRSRDRATLPLAPYINDRPYVASSFVSVALGKLFGTAMNGRSTERPELAQTPLPLEVRIPVLPCRGDPALPRKLFAPLGSEVGAEPIPLDEHVPGWSTSPTPTSHCAPPPGSPTSSATFTCCCRCSTTASTTGSVRTRSTSCCAGARAGYPSTRTAS